MMDKRYDGQVSPQNTPRFQERRILFLLAIGMLQLNLVLSAIFLSENMVWYLLAAVVVGLFAGAHWFDRRTGMWTWGYVIFWVACSFAASAVIFACHKAYRWFACYGGEAVVFTVAAVVLLKKRSTITGDRKVLYFCPVWRCDYLDAYLSGMEKDGYRLVGVSRLGRMYFQKSEPKNVRYFCTYTCLKERSMNGLEDELRSQYRANPVPTERGTQQIHRITDAMADLRHMESVRRRALFRVILERLFLATVLWTGMVLICARVNSNALLWIAVSLLIITVVYYLIGIIKTVAAEAKKRGDPL